MWLLCLLQLLLAIFLYSKREVLTYETPNFNTASSLKKNEGSEYRLHLNLNRHIELNQSTVSVSRTTERTITIDKPRQNTRDIHAEKEHESTSTTNATLVTNFLVKKTFSIYLGNYNSLNSFYDHFFEKLEKIMQESEKICKMPDSVKCIYQHSDAENADMLFYWVSHFSSSLKKQPHQLTAVYNTEAWGSKQKMLSADIRMDFRRDAEVVVSHGCAIKPSRYPQSAKSRSGIALFMSNCGATWRSNYIKELMKLVKIDSYGSCFHNVPQSASRFAQGWESSLIKTASRYRMLLTFENKIQEDYISEKISNAYLSGAIPVYWGPPDIYSWVPGDHTFIDPTKFNGAKDLADYLNRVLTDDSLYEYHTSNYEWKKSDDYQKTRCANYVEGAPFCDLCRKGYLKQKANSAKGS